jgi:nucleoside-diphosphate-sugar epimerase
MVAEATAAGLDCVVLCPPNISGAYSSFVSNVLSDVRNGRFALVDGGLRPLNTIDVDNLAHAITLALHAAKGDGKRIFVSDGVGHTWKDLADALLPLAELSAPPPTISGSALRSPPIAAPQAVSLWRSMKYLVSSDVREALRRDPLWAKFDGGLRRLAAAGGRTFEDRLRDSIEGARKVAKVPDQYPYSSRYNAMQLRGVWHRIDRAHEVLGYEPALDFPASMARFRLWYETMHGFGQQFWPLARVLNNFSGDGRNDRQS